MNRRQPAFRSPVRSLLTGVILASLLGGCVAGFVYDRLDVATSWYVASYVSLDKAQDRQLRSVVADTLEWNRRNQFAGYTRLLNELEVDSRGPMSAEVIRRRFGEMSEHWDSFVRTLAPRAAPLLKTLRPGQIDELFASLEQENFDYADEYDGVSAAERLAQRQRTAIKAIQRFTGTLDEAQRSLVRTRVAGLHDVTTEWLEHRRTWQAHLRTLVAQSGTSPGFARDLEALLLDANQFDNAIYRSQVLENHGQVFELLAKLSGTLTPRQRQHLGEKFRKYASILDDIGRQPTPAAARAAGELRSPGAGIHATSMAIVVRGI